MELGTGMGAKKTAPPRRPGIMSTPEGHVRPGGRSTVEFSLSLGAGIPWPGATNSINPLACRSGPRPVTAAALLADGGHLLLVPGRPPCTPPEQTSEPCS